MRLPVALSSAVLLAVFLAGACGGSTFTGAGADGGGDGTTSSDASTASDADGATISPDGAACVTIDLHNYDTTCKDDGNCVTISAGAICPGGCACGNATINEADQGKYAAATAGIKTLAC